MFKTLPQESKVFLTGVGIVILAANPTTYDPFNVTRFLLLTMLASVLLVSYFRKDLKVFYKEHKFIFVLCIAFSLQMILVLVFSQANLDQQIFGVFGRNLGFVSYLSLVIIFLSSLKLTSNLFIENLFKLVIYIGIICLGYSLLQALNLDPIPWANPYSPIIGVFGNPNFNSSFLGMTAGSLLVILLISKNPLKILASVYIVIALVLINLSKSIQGFLVFGFIALLLLVIVAFKKAKLRKYRYFLSISSSSLLVIVVLDILQKVPWKPFLYKSSVTQRGDLWRGAWEMGKNFPFFGVGMDSYIDYHYRSRDIMAASHGWVNELTNDAHNVPLNLLATGGFPLFIIYSLIIIYTLSKAVKVLIRMKEINHKFIAIFLLWIGYLAQSLISINHLSLATLGWALSGSIIGYEKISRVQFPQKSIKVGQNFNRSFGFIKITVGLIVGVLIGIGPSVNDRKFYSALSTGQIVLLQKVVEYRPKSVHYLNTVAEIFENNGLERESVEVAKICVDSFPNSAFAWSVIYRSKLVSGSEREFAKAKIFEINPYAKF